MTPDFIRIEECGIPTFPGRSQLRYFVDLGTTDDDGSVSTKNLWNGTDRTEAFRRANSYGLPVQDRTKEK